LFHGYANKSLLLHFTNCTQGTSYKLSALHGQHISILIQQAMHLNKLKSDLKVGEVMLRDFAKNIQYLGFYWNNAEVNV
jgi:hypothetical protein